jgi:predicted transcriptional regulator
MDVEVPVAVGNYTVFVSLESASNRVAGTVSFNLAECVDYVVSGWSIIYATPLGAGITLGADDCPYGERDGAAGSGHGGHGGGNGNATAGHGGHGGDGDSTAGPDDGGHDNSTASGGGHGGGFFEGAVAGATDPRTAAAASLAGLAGLIALSLGKWSVARIAVFGAFSRITKPKALDHQTRAAIHNFIRENPGAEVPRIMEAVGTQNGQTDYHLSVLRREGLVSVVRLGRADHHFERGRLSPADMKKIATLRSANVRQVFETVRRMPDASVGVLAATLSLSEPTVSKAVKRLVDAGLVDRQRQGRRVLLTSRAAPALA